MWAPLWRNHVDEAMGNVAQIDSTSSVSRCCSATISSVAGETPPVRRLLGS